jgi:hypothetical protein
VTRIKVAVVGAGIYGSTVAAKLAENGMNVHLFDPLGIMMGASAINQFRVHKGYHYPRSEETIREVIESRASFISIYEKSIVKKIDNYYAIPFVGSLTSVDQYEKTCSDHSLYLENIRPKWIDFDNIDQCYKVEEEIYDAGTLRKIIRDRIIRFDIQFYQIEFPEQKNQEYDYVVYATYGATNKYKDLFGDFKMQVAEKVLIELPKDLQGKSLVVVDGPFTAFDPYGSSNLFQFGSAKYTNHWDSSKDGENKIPKKYKEYINKENFKKVEFSKFSEMSRDGTSFVPLIKQAKYLGSKFTIRMVKDNSDTDGRMLYIKKVDNRFFYIFSGKVVGATKVAKKILDNILHKLPL